MNSAYIDEFEKRRRADDEAPAIDKLAHRAAQAKLRAFIQEVDNDVDPLTVPGYSLYHDRHEDCSDRCGPCADARVAVLDAAERTIMDADRVAAQARADERDGRISAEEARVARDVHAAVEKVYAGTGNVRPAIRPDGPVEMPDAFDDERHGWGIEGGDDAVNPSCCANCGRMLDHYLDDCGGAQELQHYAENAPQGTLHHPADVVAVHHLAEWAEHLGPSQLELIEAVVALAARIDVALFRAEVATGRIDHETDAAPTGTPAFCTAAAPSYKEA